ncbi:hypothetical protein BDZ91DRAFT_730740, partial [Kalaharituber pfeilii]
MPETPPGSSQAEGGAGQPRARGGQVEAAQAGDTAGDGPRDPVGSAATATATAAAVADPPPLPQPPHPSQLPMTVISTITIHALPLTSHHGFSTALPAPPRSATPPPDANPNPTTSSNSKPTLDSAPTPQPPALPLTPTPASKLNHSLSARPPSFLLPNPLDSPQISKSVKKRRAEDLSRAVENRKKGRLLSVPPPPPPPPQQTALQMVRRQSAMGWEKDRERDREASVARSFKR